VQHPLIWSKYHRARNALKAGNFGHFILFPNSPAPSACAFSALASGRSI
jgi:hypothetical protein